MPRGTLDPGLPLDFSHTGLLPSMVSPFHVLILLSLKIIPPVLNPSSHCCVLVWALPRSLATTYGITVVFFSCGYLDVSVPHVSPLHTMYSCAGT